MSGGYIIGGSLLSGGISSRCNFRSGHSGSGHSGWMASVGRGYPNTLHGTSMISLSGSAVDFLCRNTLCSGKHVVVLANGESSFDGLEVGCLGLDGVCEVINNY